MCNDRLNKVKGYRNMLNLSQEKLGDYLGISKQTYSLKEIGKVSFNDKEKSQLLDLFKQIDPNLTIDYLFF